MKSVPILVERTEVESLFIVDYELYAVTTMNSWFKSLTMKLIVSISQPTLIYIIGIFIK